MSYNAGNADVAVIGAGHAGIEAALASARMGLETVIFTINLDAVGNMPCNPAIGGTGKGQLVYEIDALGGEMGFAADKVTMQSRILNSSKGVAVHSTRVQADRRLYQQIMKETLENEPKLRVKQAQITAIHLDGTGAICGVETNLGAIWSVKAAIVCTGTFLDASVIIGEVDIASGPDGMLPSVGLAANLASHGVTLRRFKTGTPPRIHKDTIDFEKLEIQYGDSKIYPFSKRTDIDKFRAMEQYPCHIAYTNGDTHDVIRANLDKSPLYSGRIHGTGPRYCPSIEDKIVRFSDKSRHQLFVEPMGRTTKEIYLQGFSSSLPEDVQLEMLHTLSGFEHAHVMRPAYAIEYECCDSLELYPTLEFKQIPGLYGAGQFNGSSGYEEAAAQGLVAGINAALKIKGEEPLVLPRHSSYIGTLVDDLVTKGTNEPYRMMTSRSEFRLLLRQNNADERLCEYGLRIGLLSQERYNAVKEKQKATQKEIERICSIVVSPLTANPFLEKHGSSEVKSGVRMSDLLKRPELDYAVLAELDTERKELPDEVVSSVETELKYEGYLRRQESEVARIAGLENKPLPQDIDYFSIKGIRIEAQQKLDKIRPVNIGQASRISGISPADISVLLIYLKSGK